MSYLVLHMDKFKKDAIRVSRCFLAEPGFCSTPR